METPSQPVSQTVLLELLRGKGAHADPVACVEDLSADLAGRWASGHPHSIFQLLSHMNYWMTYERERIAGRKPVYPMHASESWPTEVAPASQKEWEQTVADFVSLLDEFAALARSPKSVLEREVPAMHPSQERFSSSVLAVILQMAAHNSYHTGQIALLRRALGVWPPRGGGDTW